MKIAIPKILTIKTNIMRSNTLFVLIIIFLTSLVFSSAINHGFINWDDNYYVKENRLIKDFSKEGVKKILVERTGLGGTRLTLLSFMIDHKLWGLNPKYYHAENVFWHILNSMLLFFLILRLTRNRKISFVTAILFALHPMHVESVAWISERKDVLYTFFLILCLHSYISYVRSKKPVLKGLYWIAFSLCFFLSWHSKFSAVVIPALLFLLDYILQRRFTIWLILEKVPILIFTGSEVYRIAFGSSSRMDFAGKKLIKSYHQTYSYNLFDKSLLASFSLIYYLSRFILPINLSAIVPYPVKVDGSFPQEYYMTLVLSIVVLVSIFIILYRLRRNRKEYIFGFLFFLISISIFLHYISIKGVVVVAERYSYVPYIGLSFIVGVFLDNIKNRKINGIAWGIFFVVLISISYLSYQRNKIWKNDITLFSDVLEKNPDIVEALNNRGNAYNNIREYELAILDFNRGLKLRPNYKNFYNNRAKSYHMLDSHKLAIQDLDRAIQLDSSYLDAYLNKAQIFLFIDSTKKAIEIYSQASEMAPYRAKIYMARAGAYLRLEDDSMAITDYTRAIEVYPKNYMAYFQRGRLYTKNGSLKEALDDFKTAEELKPYMPGVYNELGYVNNQLFHYVAAINNLNRAIELDSSFAEAFNNRGISNFNLHKIDNALSDFNKAIELDSVFAQVYSNRGNLRAFLEEFELALIDYNKALELSPDDCLTLVNRGNVYFQTGDKDAACLDWQSALTCGFQQVEFTIKTNCK